MLILNIQHCPLTLNLPLTSPETKDALLEWERTHGKTAASISLEYRTPDSIRQQIEDFWLAKIAGDSLIRTVFASVGEVELCLMTPDGRNIRKIGFQLGSS